MNLTYRSNFILLMGIPLFLFSSFFFLFHSKVTLLIAILATIRVIKVGFDNHKKGNWNKIYLNHDQRTRSNTLFAGYIMYWATISCLFIGVLLIQNSIISITYPKLIGFTILIGFLIRWMIRDYLNNREDIDDFLPLKEQN